MNRFFLSWCVTGALWLLACAGEDQSDAEASIELGERTIPADVREELISLGLQDQEMRQDLSPEKMQDTLFLKALLQGDSARTERVRGIVYRYGWPDSTRAGPGAARAAFLVLQHSPVHEWQKQMLPTIEDLARRGGLPRQDAAMLVDRVLMHEGLPQRYGTQVYLDGTRWVLHPVEDEVRLDDLRAEMGLPSMAEYIEMMEDFYQAPVDTSR